MSTATAFKHHQVFPICPATSAPAGFDSVAVTLAEAMALWWNLEDLSFTTTGTNGGASIGWSTVIGATESLPFIPTTTTRGGVYYASGVPARPPRERVCQPTASLLLLNGEFRVSGSTIFVKLIPWRDGGGQYYIAYQIVFDNEVAGLGVSVVNPSIDLGPWAFLTGTPASSGTFTIMGITFNWHGGGRSNFTNAWTADTASISAMSSPFTY